jgi:hypothetical protein
MEFLDNLYERSAALQQMVYVKEGKGMTWEQIALALYGILDDISTADDIAKENAELFRGMVMKLQAKKNEYLASLDGQTVQRVNESMVDFARYELELGGLFSKDSDYEGMLGEAVMELISKFADQGHSGFSAGMTAHLFSELAAFKPLTELTDNPAEWTYISEQDPRTPDGTGDLWQSKRCPSAFSEDGGKTYYDIDDPSFNEAVRIDGPEKWKNLKVVQSKSCKEN